MNTVDTVTVLNRLILTSKNGESALRAAADEAWHEELKQSLLDYSRFFGTAARELQDAVRQAGGRPRGLGTFGNTLHRTWMHIHAKALGRDERAILDDVEQDDRVFAVFVQVKGRSYLMNPAGHCDRGETLEECAVRETLEETGLSIELMSVDGESSVVADWTFKQWFGGVRWKSRTTAFYGKAECPADWDLSENVNRVESSNDGTAYLVVVDVRHRAESPIGGAVSE